MDLDLFRRLSTHCTAFELVALGPLVEHDRETGLQWLSDLSNACQDWIELNNVMFHEQRQEFITQAIQSHDWDFVQRMRDAFVQHWADPLEARAYFERRILDELREHDIPIEHYDAALGWKQPMPLERWPQVQPDYTCPIALRWQTQKLPGFWAYTLTERSKKNLVSLLTSAATAGVEVLNQALEALPPPRAPQRDGLTVEQLLGHVWTCSLKRKHPDAHKGDALHALAQTQLPIDLGGMDSFLLSSLAQWMAKQEDCTPIIRVLQENLIPDTLVRTGMSEYNLTELIYLHKADLDFSKMRTEKGETLVHLLVNTSQLRDLKPLLLWCVLTNPALLDCVDNEGRSVRQCFVAALDQPTPLNENVGPVKAQLQALLLQFETTPLSGRPRARI